MSILEDLKLHFRAGDITTKLIFWNVVLFVVPNVVEAISRLFGNTSSYLFYVSLSSVPSELFWKPWSIVSYSFFHAGIWHIVFNMLMLNFAGRLFLTFFPQKQLLGLYIAGGVFAGFLYILGYMFFPALVNINASLVGASASIMAILFATVAYSPLMEIRLLLIGNVKLWHVALALIVIDLIQLPAENTGGHMAHLGGAFFGYIYIIQLKAGRDIVSWIAHIPESISLLFSGKKKAKMTKVHRNYTVRQQKTTSRIVTKDKAQQQIDEILDKISKSGYDSLTKEEKEFLFRAGKQ